MGEINRWMRLVDWFEYAILRKIGLVRLKTHLAETHFYHDWLVDIATNEPISEREKSSILGGWESVCGEKGDIK